MVLLFHQRTSTAISLIIIIISCLHKESVSY